MDLKRNGSQPSVPRAAECSTRRVRVDPLFQECVRIKESPQQALQSARPGAMVSFVGVPHGVELSGAELFYGQRGLMGGPAPVRRFPPRLMDLVLNRKIAPGKVFDLSLPLDDVAEGNRAMEERRASKVLLRV